MVNFSNRLFRMYRIDPEAIKELALKGRDKLLIKPEGWHLLAIFTATIVGFILRPWPTGIMAIQRLYVIHINQFLYYN